MLQFLGPMAGPIGKTAKVGEGKVLHLLHRPWPLGRVGPSSPPPANPNPWGHTRTRARGFRYPAAPSPALFGCPSGLVPGLAARLARG